MKALELKIPPPAIALLVAVAMWGISRATPSVAMSGSVRLVAVIAIALAGVCFAISGVIAIRLAKTTLNPTKPETTSSLVTAGVYRLTRNPMYVGLALALLAFAVFLSSIWALLGPMAFILYMNRFQIVPEERVLSGMFGAAYAVYRGKVRRWL